MRRKKRITKKTRTTKRPSREQLIALAAEPVPFGSGFREYGRGQYCYLKTALDGSTRCFRFRSMEATREAMAAGIAADEPLPGVERGVA